MGLYRDTRCICQPRTRGDQLRFLFPRGVPFLPLYSATPQQRRFLFFLFIFFSFLLRLRSCNYNPSTTPRDEVIRAYVSEVSILLASHGTGKNRDRIDRNLKRSSGMHYMTARNWFFYGHLIHFARVFFFFRQDRKPPLHSLNVFQSKNISTFIKS